MKIFDPKARTRRKNYKAERMSRLRCEVLGWMQEYEHAKTARHRNTCMDAIQMNLRKYEWYGNR